MKNTYNGQAIPADGKAIGYSGGELQVPDNPDDSVYRGRWHRARYLESVAARVRCRGGAGLRREAEGGVV